MFTFHHPVSSFLFSTVLFPNLPSTTQNLTFSLLSSFVFDSNNNTMSTTKILLVSAAAFATASATTFFEDKFETDPLDGRWVESTHKEEASRGSFAWSAGKNPWFVSTAHGVDCINLRP
tara:strand:- start:214 stop:570 length:357 start_codon:yes stop_codon:yes gene_type:complete